MTPTERTHMIAFWLVMLMASGLTVRALIVGVYGIPPRNRNRAQTFTLLAPVMLSLVGVAIFPWSAIF